MTGREKEGETSAGREALAGGRRQREAGDREASKLLSISVSGHQPD